MKKIILLFMVLLVVPSYASDRLGQGNTTILSEMITQFYIETFGNAYGTPHKFADTTTVEYLLNTSSLDASTDLNCVERDTTIYTLTDSNWYDLPSDFYDVPANLSRFGVTVKSSSGTRENAMSLIAVDQIGTKSQSATAGEIGAWYCIRKGRIYIEPANNDSDAVKVYYAALANELDTATDTTNIDRKYIRYIVLKAAEKFLRTRNWGSYQSVASERLGIVQTELAREETLLGITRKSLMEKTVQ